MLKILGLLSGLSLAGLLQAADYAALPAGALQQVRLDELHPTQAVVGHGQIHYKLGRLAKEPGKLFDEYCEANGQGESSRVPAGASVHRPDSFTCQGAVGSRSSEMKTVVVGPGGRLFLTDGHHTFTTLWEQPQAGAALRVWVKVTDNFSDSPDLASFWQRMQQARKVWLRDGQGRPISAQQIPAQLGLDSLADDPYRALVYFTREVAYDKPRSGDVAPEFLEFYWGSWLREKLPLADYDLNEPRGYRAALAAAAELMVAQPADAPLGASGFTARQLGGYAQVDRRELGKVATRKLGYLFQYRQAH